MAIAHAASYAENPFGVVGGSDFDTQSYAAVADGTWLLAIPYRGSAASITVADSLGELTWTQRLTGCSGRISDIQFELWTAQGSPSGDFTINIAAGTGTFFRGGAGLGVYTGVDSFEDPEWANTNGEEGACTGGSDNDDPTGTLTATVADAVHWQVTGYRATGNSVATPDGNFTQRAVSNTGNGGDPEAELELYDYFQPTAASEECHHILTAASDWMQFGIVLKPAGGGGGGSVITPSLALLGVGA